MHRASKGMNKNKQNEVVLDSQQRVLDALRDAREQIEALKKPRDQRIAIIGMAARMPGAESIEELWEMLQAGHSGIRNLSEEELRASKVSATEYSQQEYVPAWASFEEPSAFDAGLFGYSPREATVIDPQHRVFLECAWAALEDAGHDASEIQTRVGVFAGAALNDYLLTLNADTHLRNSINPVEVVVSNVIGLMPTRVAYHLNLKGPACAVQTGCSTSLVAVHTACRSLLDGDCDVALAGGVTIGHVEPRGYMHEPGGIASPDGKCRAFDAEGKGTLFGNGVGVVVLKPLAAALNDGDNILAVVAGSAINNDGDDKVGLLAPSVSGQAGVIADAWQRAQLDPACAEYIEAHGTATELGDPIEFTALEQAMGVSLRESNSRCGIGSIKTNVGHLDAAAGIAGLIKVVLAMQHEILPASLNYVSPNPHIALDSSPFYVVAKNQPWPRGESPRRAGVSSFGMGGTNAHVVLEDAPLCKQQIQSRDDQWQVLPISARTDSALDLIARRLAKHLQERPHLIISEVAHTLQKGRRALNMRRVYLARSRDEAVSVLSAPPLTNLQANPMPGQPAVVFLFSGQGSQYPGMARHIYKSEPVFRKALDECAEILSEEINLMALLSANVDPDQLNQTANTQPVLFALEYALAQLWLSRGIEPQALLGHSIGEYVAACVAGVFNLTDALATVVLRGKLMQSCSPGAMLAVMADQEYVERLLSPEIELAVQNGKQSFVLGGSCDAIQALRKQLDKESVVCAPLAVSHAFHTSMMQAILSEFSEHVSKLELHAPKIDIIGNRTGDYLSTEEVCSASYWVEQLRHSVLFADCIQCLTNINDVVCLEIGPGEVLSRLVSAESNNQIPAIPSLPSVQQAAHSERWLQQAVGRLWLHGIDIDWQSVAIEHYLPRKVSLPTYPFERKNHYPYSENSESSLIQTHVNEHEKLTELEKWFHVQSWDRIPITKTLDKDKQRWIVCGTAASLQELVVPPEIESVQITSSNEWKQIDHVNFCVDFNAKHDWSRLFEQLDASDKQSQLILLAEPCTVEGDQNLLNTLAAIAQALDAHRNSLLISVLISKVFDVTGAETVNATGAMIAGFTQVLGQEIPDLQCRVIDYENLQQASIELQSHYDYAARIVAWRDRHRWLRSYHELSLNELPASGLIKQATYVVVGDLIGGLGMIYARALREKLNARVILIGPSHLPSSEEWQNKLDNKNNFDPTSQFVVRLQALGQEGEDWQLHRIDICDQAALAQAITHGGMRFGPITGVFHADVMGDAAACGVNDLTPEKSQQIMQNKVQGAQALQHALKGHKPEFVILQSSLSAVVGGPGFAAYAAANCFLDAYAPTIDDARWISINWDACQLDDESITQGSQLMAAAFSADEVWAVTQRVLAAEALHHVIATPRPLARRIVRAFDSSLVEDREQRMDHARPELNTDYVEPKEGIEQAVAQAIAELLGIERVGRDDDFFALGGNSLLAIQAVTRLRNEFGVEIPMRALLYGTPTVAGIAQVIEENLAGLSDENVEAVEQLLEDLEKLSPEEASK